MEDTATVEVNKLLSGRWISDTPRMCRKATRKIATPTKKQQHQRSQQSTSYVPDEKSTNRHVTYCGKSTMSTGQEQYANGRPNARNPDVSRPHQPFLPAVSSTRLHSACDATSAVTQSHQLAKPQLSYSQSGVLVSLKCSRDESGSNGRCALPQHQATSHQDHQRAMAVRCHARPNLLRQGP